MTSFLNSAIWLFLFQLFVDWTTAQRLGSHMLHL